MVASPSTPKKEKLIALLSRWDNVAIAFSGGVDSTFLLAVAHDVLGSKAVAFTAVSPIHPSFETEAAVAFARSRNIEQVLIPSTEMELPDFTANGRSRCYICKKNLFQEMLSMCDRRGIQRIAHGANLDDLEDYRPGYRATVELGILAPMIEVGMTKDDIRRLSKAMGLSTWNKAPMACLASRIPYHSPIERETLARIEAAEQFLWERGYNGFRVRHHRETARIEMSPSGFERICDPSERELINHTLQQMGYTFVAVDLGGYQSGNMNKGIIENGKDKKS